MGATKRVIEYIDFKGISKYKFCKSLGFSNKFLDNSDNMGTDKACKILQCYPEINPEWLLTGVGKMLRDTGSISISGDNKGVANTGEITGNVIYNNENTPDNTKDINMLYNTYNDNKIVEIDRLQSLYTTIISEKNEIIQELKVMIKDLREDKRLLSNIIEKLNNS